MPLQEVGLDTHYTDILRHIWVQFTILLTVLLHFLMTHAPRVYDTLDVWYHDKMESDWGINEKVDAEAGKLIIFPSWLKH